MPRKTAASQSEMHKNGHCIIWKGSTNKGYGQFRYKDPRDHKTADHKTRSAHRMALLVKLKDLDIPPKQQASHLCNNKLCINNKY